MRTAGIDLSTQPGRTAVCTIEWTRDLALVSFALDTTDAGLIEVCHTFDKIGIDCPFGWPEPFVHALGAHIAGLPWPGRAQPTNEFRTRLAFRTTDRYVRETTGQIPLSVSTNLIGMTTMRCALLLDALGEVDRAGTSGAVVEVYPAATLRTWGLPNTAYKRSPNRPALAALLDLLITRIPQLDFAAGARERCARSDDAFDALVCALTARAAAQGRTLQPSPGEQARRAAVEGWIHLPMDLPEALVYSG
jgi:predicted nuclease with RNAse H fold